MDGWEGGFWGLPDEIDGCYICGFACLGYIIPGSCCGFVSECLYICSIIGVMNISISLMICEL